MAADLGLLFDTIPRDAPREAYRTAIVEDNVLGKRTVGTRKHTLQSLRELYAFDPAVPLFHGLRVLASADPEALPVLALLCALGRDELLRASAGAVLPLAPGTTFFKADLDRHIEQRFPGRFKPDGRDQVAQITASSWTQGGHLDGRARKVRRAVEVRPASLAYALLLGYLSGARSHALLDTEWTHVLDASPEALLARLNDVSRPGWFSLRHAGDILDLTPTPALMPDAQVGAHNPTLFDGTD